MNSLEAEDMPWPSILWLLAFSITNWNSLELDAMTGTTFRNTGSASIIGLGGWDFASVSQGENFEGLEHSCINW